jgi:DNA-binding NtrC family response regulator
MTRPATPSTPTADREEDMSPTLEVMVLDDEPTVGKRLAPALTKIGCVVETFVDPLQALKRIDEKEFDIIITDVVMTEATGVQVLEYAMKKSPRTKVIVITAFAMMSLAREAMEKGAFDFVAKPFHLDELRRVVQRAAAALGISLAAPPATESPTV